MSVAYTYEELCAGIGYDLKVSYRNQYSQYIEQMMVMKLHFLYVHPCITPSSWFTLGF